MSAAWISLLACWLALQLTGCASEPVRGTWRPDMDGLPGPDEAAALVWPARPEPARYAWAGRLTGEPELHRPEPAGGASLWRRVGRWIAGLDGADEAPLQLQRPSAVSGDAHGRIYVSDAARRAVFVFDLAGGTLALWERAGPGLNWVSPVGLAPGPDGTLDVADAELGWVVRLDARGEPRGQIGRGLLQRPTGLARDPASGRLYVADTRAHDIKVFDAAGRLERTLGGPGSAPGRFNAPTHLALADGLLYVTDSLNARVQVLRAADGAPLRQIGSRGLVLGQLVRPKGLAVDGAGRIHVVESYHDTVLVYDDQGRLLLPIGPASASMPPVARFLLPAGIWVAPDGDVWVADMFNARLARLRPVGHGASPDDAGATSR
ncbi:NHL repeat-containing protein [Leptothrix discophora]|uniref:6-bladed beta-propeller n=1 Tax=Leptothrix discophora TaxID=89 RepID=A0ABT9FY86_LEPDI|nr:6-bladed beta-propeller [Leptothrix discophora]MDP4299111.1 6-bladed beta-propeller [Leptothrix discophora]